MSTIIKKEDYKVTVTDTTDAEGKRIITSVELSVTFNNHTYNKIFNKDNKPANMDFNNFAYMLPNMTSLTLMREEEVAKQSPLLTEKFQMYYEHVDGNGKHDGLKFWADFEMEGKVKVEYTVDYGKYATMLGLDYPTGCAKYTNIADAEKDFAKLVAIDSRFTFANILKSCNSTGHICFSGLYNVSALMFIGSKLENAYNEFMFDQKIKK